MLIRLLLRSLGHIQPWQRVRQGQTSGVSGGAPLRHQLCRTRKLEIISRSDFPTSSCLPQKEVWKIGPNLSPRVYLTDTSGLVVTAPLLATKPDQTRECYATTDFLEADFWGTANLHVAYLEQLSQTQPECARDLAAYTCRDARKSCRADRYCAGATREDSSWQ